MTVLNLDYKTTIKSSVRPALRLQRAPVPSGRDGKNSLALGELVATDFHRITRVRWRPKRIIERHESKTAGARKTPSEFLSLFYRFRRRNVPYSLRTRPDWFGAPKRRVVCRVERKKWSNEFKIECHSLALGPRATYTVVGETVYVDNDGIIHAVFCTRVSDITR